MSAPDSAPEQADLEERIYQGLRRSCDSDLRKMAKLLASKPYKHLPGQAEFEVRDLAHDLGATALETALNERKKGATKDPARAARTAATRPVSSAIAPRVSSACRGRSAPTAPITTASGAIGATAPAITTSG